MAILFVVVCHVWCSAAPSRGGELPDWVVWGVCVRGQAIAYLAAISVRLFFVLSAFLLYLPYAMRVAKAQEFSSPQKFYRRRALRILPAYWFVIIFYTVVCAGIMNREAPNLLRIVINAFFLQLPAEPLFARLGLKMGLDYIPGTWSLTPEIWFYAVLPWVALMTRKDISFACVFVLTLAAAIFYRATINPMNLPEVYQTNVLSLADYFAFGMLAARLYAGNLLDMSGVCGVVFWRLGTYLGLVLCLHAWFGLPARYKNIGMELETAVGGFLLVLGLLKSRTALRALMESRVFCFLGKISYSLFLWNIILIYYGAKPCLLALGISGTWFYTLLALTAGVVCVIVGWISYTYIELPFLSKSSSAQAQRG
ncbi:MAG: acyltransferase [Verrucomicrobia bacterium]|nr:acyltransferase [Verrucomicrobiota bacterium]